MSGSVFVDSNVLVYARDMTEGEKQQTAADWIRHLWIERSGRLSAQVLNEFYVTVTRKLSPGLTREDAWDDVCAFLSWEPQAITPELLRWARGVEARHGLSWWDSMIVASAQMQGCGLLLSEDLQDGWVCDGLIVRSPFTHQVSEGVASYETAPKPISRHPPRGRPTRFGRAG